MSSFALLRRNSSIRIAVEQIDLNIWVLPALFRRQIYLCDVGICCKLSENASGQSIELELRTPFLPDKEVPLDLVPRMRESESLCSLVFGSSNLNLTRNDLGTWINDDNGPLLLTDLPAVKRQNSPGPETRSASWILSTGPVTLTAGTRVYLRLRITTHNPNRIWIWQTGANWNSHAVCDLRFNEFREKGTGDFPVDFSKVINPRRINGFLITPARYKAGRISPAPKYIRILESDSWVKYIGRQLSRNGELFLITYWKDINISSTHPYRAFMEVEKRHPRTANAVAAATCLLMAFFLFIQPVNGLTQSPAGVIVKQIKPLWPIFFGGVSISAAWTVSKFLIKHITNGDFKQLSRVLNHIERWWYRS